MQDPGWRNLSGDVQKRSVKVLKDSLRRDKEKIKTTQVIGDYLKDKKLRLLKIQGRNIGLTYLIKFKRDMKYIYNP